MTDRLRILVAMTRLPVVLLLALFTATGLAHAGGGNDPFLLAAALVPVLGYLLFSVVVNDLADEAIDRVNLPGDAGRPLVTGASGRRQLTAVAVGGAVAALGGSALLHGSTVAVTVMVAGMVLSLAYSLRPVRIADRGALASLLLPAGYVGVPYLLGILAVRPHVVAGDLVLLGGLYVGFIGRIVLKDFRDVRGDALFGKRTFLVRHGRGATCAFSACCWVVGVAALVGVREANLALVSAYVVCVVAALVLLRALAADRGARRDEALISAIAIVGRGAIVSVVAHLAAVDAGWTAGRGAVLLVAVAGVFLGQAAVMARRGPSSRLAVPAEWSEAAAAAPVAPAARLEPARLTCAGTRLTCAGTRRR